MDTTKKHIEMCREAWKYLRREIEPDDVVAYRYIYDDYISEGVGYFFCIAEKWIIREKNVSEVESDYIFVVWKQDQLQEILNIPVWDIVWEFEKFTEEMTEPDCFKNKSMEQLWLAFVMKEKYNKVWDDKKKVWSEEKDVN